MQLSNPKVSINIIPADTKVPNAAQRVLLVGEIGTGATLAPDQIYENVQAPPENTDPFDPYFWLPGSPEILFGPDSILCRMIRDFKDLNKVTQVDVYPYTLDPPGSPSTARFDLVGTATSDGILRFQITSPFYEFEVPITNGDTAVDIAIAASAAVAANPTSLVVLDNPSAGTLLVEPKNLGFYTASTAAFRVLDLTATGLTIENVDSPVPNGHYTRTNAISLVDAIGSQRYQTIVYPYVEQLVLFFDPTQNILPLLDNWNVDNAIQDFMLLTGYPYPDDGTGTPVNNPMTNFLDSFSDQMVALFTDDGPILEDSDVNPLPLNACFNIFEHTPVVLSKFAAIRSLRLSDGEDISEFVITRQGPLDSFGGPALASKPYFNTPLPGVTVIGEPGFGLDKVWQDIALEAGAFTANLNTAGTEVIFGQVPTTYKTDQAGNPDISYKFVNYVDTISNCREYFFNNLKRRFAQSRLTNGDVIKGRDMANAETVAAYCEELYQDLSGRDFVLAQAGEDAIAYFKANLNVIIDTSIGRATVSMKMPIVTQLREILATMQLSFGTEG